MLYAQDTQKWATYQKEDYKTNAKNEVKSKNQCGTCGQFSASSLLVSLNTSAVTSLEGFFFCDRRQEKDETRLLRRNKLTCDKRSCSRFKQRGHPGYTTCIWATRTPQCIALKITLGWETVPAGGNGACLSGRDKKSKAAAETYFDKWNMSVKVPQRFGCDFCLSVGVGTEN